MKSVITATLLLAALPALAGKTIFLRTQGHWTNESALVYAMAPRSISTNVVTKVAARELLTEAARAGSFEAAICLVTNSYEIDIPLDSTNWFRAEAQKGNVMAQYQLGLRLLQSGHNDEALRWLEVVAAKKNPHAQRIVGDFYLKQNRNAEAERLFIESEAYDSLIDMNAEKPIARCKWIFVSQMRGHDHDYARALESTSAQELKQAQSEARAYCAKRWPIKK